MALSSRIVKQARTYLGTPYLHQGRTLHGLDCVGLVICVAHDLGISDYDIDHYARVPSGRMMMRILQENCKRVSLCEIQPGDLLHIAFEQQPQHLAIVTDHGMCHADSRHGVVEHTLSDGWKKKVRGCYRMEST